jgi:hypothetical protein
MPISSFPAAPVDSAGEPVLVPLAPAAPAPVGLMGDPVMEGLVELPEGMTIMLPEAVALPDAVGEAEADPEEVGTSVAGRLNVSL